MAWKSIQIYLNRSVPFLVRATVVLQKTRVSLFILLLLDFWVLSGFFALTKSVASFLGYMRVS